MKASLQLLCFVLLSWSVRLGVAEERADRSAIAAEAFLRLPAGQVEQSPKLKEALEKVLEGTRGTPKFVELVKHFQLTNQTARLLEMAAESTDEQSRADAVRLVLESGNSAAAAAALEEQTGKKLEQLIGAIGNSGHREAIGLLIPLISKERKDVALRKEALRLLARGSDGAEAILKLAAEERLPADLKLTAASELNRAPWPALQQRAARLLPLPEGQNAQPLPPIGDLVARKGDPAKGRKIFFSPEAGCATCHRVKERGIDFGPDLSQIGTKLGRDALYEAILDPSAGISFGYEAWQVELKSGDEAYGLLVSETPDEIAIKDQRGIVTRYPKKAIEDRRQMQLSIMPGGLQQIMSVEDLVDLVEYLASLQAPAAAPQF